MREDIKKRVPGARVYLRERSKFWQIQYTENGRKIRQSSGVQDEDTAWQELDRIYSQRNTLSFRQAAVDFFEVKKKTLAPTTVKGYLFALQNVNPTFGDKYLREIDLEMIKGFVAKRRLEVSDTTVRRELAFLSSVFTHAQVEMTGAPEHHPFIGYSKRHLKENRREYYLTPPEFERLLSVCPQEWQRMVLRVAVFTGMRHQEICALRKDWINWSRGVHGEIQLPKELTKAKRARVIPILPELSDTLKTWVETDDSPWVFSRRVSEEEFKPYTSFQGFFRLARKNAKLESLRFHDLRHTFASWWVQRGGTLLVLKDILGHATLQMVDRYAHLDTDASHREVQKFVDTL